MSNAGLASCATEFCYADRMNCSIRSRISHSVFAALIVSVVAALATSACGGGNESDPSPTSPTVNVP
jgi:hypothetical protein